MRKPSVKVSDGFNPLWRSFPSCVQMAFNHAIPFLEDRSDAACRVVFVGLPKRIPFLSINEIGYRIWVGAVPSAASARPVHVGLAAVRNAERREAHASPRGLRAPAAPAPPFFGSPKKGGEESSPLATSLGFCPRRATRPSCPSARTRASRESRAQAHAQKPRSPQAPARGKKNAAQATHTKNALPIELGEHA